jgi:hypothetical protein
MSEHAKPSPGREHNTAATRAEQALCLSALDSGEFDHLSDMQWVALCERLSREEKHRLDAMPDCRAPGARG